MQAVTDIDGILIQKFSFLEAIVGEEYSLFGYNYLSIIPDGAINPLVNYPGASQNHEPDFYFKFRDNTKVLINGAIENLPVYKQDQIKLYYQAYSQENATLQGGYGNFYLILSRTRIPVFKRCIESPSAVINVSLAGGAINHYWIGIEKPISDYNSIIPYIPQGYSKIGWFYWTDSSSHYFKIYQYPQHFNDITDEALNQIATGSGTVAIHGSGRYRIELRNSDGTPRGFKVYVVFLDRSIA